MVLTQLLPSWSPSLCWDRKHLLRILYNCIQEHPQCFCYFMFQVSLELSPPLQSNCYTDRCDPDLLRDLHCSAPRWTYRIMNATPPTLTPVPAAKELNQLGHQPGSERTCGVWHVHLLFECQGVVQKTTTTTLPVGESGQICICQIQSDVLFHWVMIAWLEMEVLTNTWSIYARPFLELLASLIFHLALICIIEASMYHFWRLSCHTEGVL